LKSLQYFRIVKSNKLKRYIQNALNS